MDGFVRQAKQKKETKKMLGDSKDKEIRKQCQERLKRLKEFLRNNLTFVSFNGILKANLLV